MRWNFADIIEAVATRVPPEHTALIHGDATVSWRELQRRADDIGGALLRCGLRPGDKVAFYMRNKPAYLETLLACFKAGLVHVNVNYRYKRDELVYLFDNADARAVVFDREFAGQARQVRGELPGVLAWIEVDGATRNEAERWYPYSDFSASGEGAGARFQRSPDDHFFIYTGGTTGQPKGVMWTHDILLRAQLAYNAATEGRPAPASLAEFVERLTPAHFAARQLPAPPLMHATGVLGALGTLIRGGSVVTLGDERGFDAAALWQAASRHRVTTLTIVGDAFAGPLLQALEETPGRFDLGALQAIVSSGVVWSRHNKRALLKHLPHLTLLDSLGSTEAPACGIAVMTAASESEPPRFRLSPTCRVFSEDGRAIAPGSEEPGLLALGGNIPLGYYKDEEKTRKTFRVFEGQRFAVPGDLCRVEPDGGLTFLGRGSQCINTGGEKVFAEEVEDALKSHPHVGDAIVIGMPDPKWGQAVIAVVALGAGSRPDEAALKQHVRSRLADYKVPKRVLFRDDLQRLPNGKADYRGMRAFAEEQLAAEVAS